MLEVWQRAGLGSGSNHKGVGRKRPLTECKAAVGGPLGPNVLSGHPRAGAALPPVAWLR